MTRCSGLLLCLTLILTAANSACAAPESRTFPGGEWEHRDPGEVGLDGQALDDLADMLGGRGCVVRHGYVVKSWGDQAERGDWLSSAKPVLSTLLFFAIEEGLATGVDQPIVEFGWDLRPEDRAMTFRHLGAMSSGYGRPEGPGEAWAYNDYAIMLYQKTLFDRVFKGDAEAIANDPARLGALGLQDGLRFSSKRRLSASARDFARIAWFWLNRGRWGDREVLDRRFFDDYMKPQTPKDLPHTAKADTDDYLGIGSFGGGSDHFTEYGAGIYGMNWWFNGTGRLHPERRTWPDAPADTVMSIGAGGNCSVVIPSLDLVLVCARGDWGGLAGGDSSAKMNGVIGRLVAGVTGEGSLPAFPGAEGFGAFTPGGRGGKVFLVTTLEDYHPRNEAAIPGSLREAVAAEGPRIIVFRVGGNIKLKAALVVTSPCITITGQTAPGGGVCLTTYPLIIGTHDVIVRHLRVRLGDESKAELGTLDVYGGQNVIVDHCSVSWAIDECFSVTGADTRNITVQWCIIGGGLNRSFHPKGEHGHGSLLRSGGGGMTFHHNVYAHNYSRSPRPGSYPDTPGLLLDFRNNLIYNWGKDAGYSGEHRLLMNYVNNYLKPGPSTRDSQRRYAFSVGGTKNSLFFAGNHFDGYPDSTKDNWLMVRPSSRLRAIEGWDGDLRGAASAPRSHPAPPIGLQSPEDAYRSILRGVGATLPARDALDRRLMREIKTGTGTIIDSQDDLGGWPRLRSGRAPKDSDLDGMPDRWEKWHRLLAGDPADNAGDADGDGYTNIEEYLNGTDPQVRDEVEVGFSFPEILAQVNALNAEARREIEAEKRELAGKQRDSAGALLEATIEPAPDGLPESVTVTLGEGVEMSMRLLPAGTFTMGSPEDEEGRDPDETQHAVTLSRPFYMGATSVTHEQFATAFGKSLEDPADAGMPVTRVKWSQAVEFCEILSRATGHTFRLPTEAEWEYACRAGTQTPFSTGHTITTDQANFNGEYVYGNGTPGIYRRSAMPVGSFPPNAWGIYDMHGNVFEWCSDFYGEYPDGSATDPTGPEEGGNRVIRGGNHGSHPRYIRSGARYRYRPDTWFGFRVVMEVAPRPGRSAVGTQDPRVPSEKDPAEISVLLETRRTG